MAKPTNNDSESKGSKTKDNVRNKITNFSNKIQEAEKSLMAPFEKVEKYIRSKVYNEDKVVDDERIAEMEKLSDVIVDGREVLREYYQHEKAYRDIMNPQGDSPTNFDKVFSAENIMAAASVSVDRSKPKSFTEEVKQTLVGPPKSFKEIKEELKADIKDVLIDGKKLNDPERAKQAFVKQFVNKGLSEGLADIEKPSKTSAKKKPSGQSKGFEDKKYQYGAKANIDDLLSIQIPGKETVTVYYSPRDVQDSPENSVELRIEKSSSTAEEVINKQLERSYNTLEQNMGELVGKFYDVAKEKSELSDSFDKINSNIKSEISKTEKSLKKSDNIIKASDVSIARSNNVFKLLGKKEFELNLQTKEKDASYVNEKSPSDQEGIKEIKGMEAKFSNAQKGIDDIIGKIDADLAALKERKALLNEGKEKLEQLQSEVKGMKGFKGFFKKLLNNKVLDLRLKRCNEDLDNIKNMEKQLNSEKTAFKAHEYEITGISEKFAIEEAKLPELASECNKEINQTRESNLQWLEAKIKPLRNALDGMQKVYDNTQTSLFQERTVELEKERAEQKSQEEHSKDSNQEVNTPGEVKEHSNDAIDNQRSDNAVEQSVDDIKIPENVLNGFSNVNSVDNLESSNSSVAPAAVGANNQEANIGR